jgi:hypothetical protein
VEDELNPKSNTCDPVLGPNLKLPFAVAPVFAGSAVAVTTSNLFIGAVVPIPVWALAFANTPIDNIMNTTFFIY